jgi:hypothetical protein
MVMLPESIPSESFTLSGIHFHQVASGELSLALRTFYAISITFPDARPTFYGVAAQGVRRHHFVTKPETTMASRI